MGITLTDVTEPDGSIVTTATDDVTGDVLYTVVTYPTPPEIVAENANKDTLIERAKTALANNVTYLALSPPTTAQAVAQVAALTRQVDALIRITVGQLDSTDGVAPVSKGKKSSS